MIQAAEGQSAVGVSEARRCGTNFILEAEAFGQTSVSLIRCEVAF